MRNLLMLAGLWVGVLEVAVQAQDPAAERDNQTIKWDGVNLQALTYAVQRRTGKQFMWTQELGLNTKTVNFKGLSTEDPVEIFARYQSVLEMNNLGLVPVGEPGKEVYKIGLKDMLFRKAVPIEQTTENPDDRFVTRLFSLKYIGAGEAHRALVQLATNPMGVYPVENAGILMVTDYDYNIKRFEKMIEIMDVKRPDIEMKVVQLRNALATDLQQTLNELVQVILQQAGMGGRNAVVPGMPGQNEQVKITADKRTNSVVILAQPQRMEQILELVARLDSEAGFETAGIYFLRLKHTDAEEMAKTLNSIFGTGPDSSSSGTGTRQPSPAVAGAATPTPTLGSSPAPTPGTGGASGTTPTIVADKRSNTIMVLTDRNTFRTIEGIVQRLDQRRPQVLIKATVAEIRASDDFDFGVELGRLVDPESRIVGEGVTNFGNSTLTPDPTNNVYNLVPKGGQGITLAIVKDRIFNIGFLLRALQGVSSVKVMDEPQAMTVDNGFARMKVNDQVPVTTDTITATGFVQKAFKEFQTAETVLEISPHISEGGYLRMETTVKIEKFSKAESTDSSIPPPKTSREISTKAIHVPSGQTVVIGGIVTEDESENTTGVPLLSDIPILGPLFRREQRSGLKRTLYIFITPSIIEDDSFADLKDLTRERAGRLEMMSGRPIEGLEVEGPVDAGVRTTFQFHPVREEEHPEN